MAKKDYHLTLAEQETIITFNAADKTANIYSASPTWINKIKKFDGWRESGPGAEVDVPKSWIKIVRPMNLSAEERERRAAVLRRARARLK